MNGRKGQPMKPDVDPVEPVIIKKRQCHRTPDGELVCD